MTHFFGILLDPEVPDAQGAELCREMARAFDTGTYVLEPTVSLDRLSFGFAVPRALAGRFGDADRVARRDRLVLFGDVTLYNRESIPAGSAQDGPAAGANSDIELLHRFLRYGGDPARLNGDYAFGMYDEAERSLTLVRDQIGNRILYYARRPEGLIFSTRIHAFFEVGFDRRDVDPIALASYLVMRFPGAGRTYYQDISELPPAHLLSVAPDRLPATKRFWSLQPDPGLAFKRPGDWIDYIRSVFLEAVTSRMADAERPGLKLSGGLDSSAVAGAMCSENRHLRISGFAHVPGGVTIQTDHDEDALYLRSVSDIWDNLSLHRIRSNQFDTLSGPTRWKAVSAAPCIDPFQFAEDAIAEAIIGENVDIVLSGYAGDHCVSGYSHPVLLEQILRLNWAAAQREFQRLRKENGKSVFDIVVGRILSRLVPTRLKNARKALLGRPWHADLAVNADYLANREFLDHLRTNQFYALVNDPLTMQAQHRRNITAEMSHFIAFEDRFQGEQGYRSRRPMLDIDLLQSVMSAPSSLMVSDRHDRALIRQVAKPFLPDAVYERTGKSPFVPDYPARFRACAPSLISQIGTFQEFDLWRQVVDVQKVMRATDQLGRFQTMDDAQFVDVLHLVLMPNFAGGFLSRQR